MRLGRVSSPQERNWFLGVIGRALLAFAISSAVVVLIVKVFAR